MMLQDRGGHGYVALGKTAAELIARANATEGLASVFTFYDTRFTPTLRRY